MIQQIHRNPRITPSRLADLTGLQRSNISTAVRTLEALGMVVREQPASDGRGVELVATDLASENLDRLHRYWADRLGEAGPEVLDEVLSAVEPLNRLADRLTG